jgi:hypothetical protein
MLIAYEIIVSIVFAATLAWTLRMSDPVALGALIGGFMLSGFDWLWCSRGFWNATIPSGLTMIPGLDVQGLRYPFSICFIWAIGFGFLPYQASRYHDRLAAHFGRLHLPLVFALAALIDLVVEWLGVSIFGAWRYHQQPSYLILGVPWSNLWFLGGVLSGSYFGLARVRRWSGLVEGSGLSFRSEDTLRGVLMAASAIWTCAFLLGTLQLFWWSATSPWVESGRPF